MRIGTSISLFALFCLSACMDLSASSECYAHPDDDVRVLTCTVFPKELYWLEEDGVYEGDFAIVDDKEHGQIVIVDGDISLGPAREVLEEHREIERNLNSGIASRVEELVMDVRPIREWPDDVILYRLDDDILNDRRKLNAVEDAIAFWNNNFADLAGLRWENDQSLRPKNRGVYIKRSENGCSAEVGAGVMLRQRRRDLNLGEGCFKRETILHEMSHSMGARHEHQRYDRDEHILLIEENISDEWKRRKKKRININKKNNNRQYRAIGSYDVSSLMHYTTIAISADVMRGARLPVFLNRAIFDILHIEHSSRHDNTHNIESRVHNYNDKLTINGKNISMKGMRVMDVDGDGFDDLVREHNGEIWWSSRGSSGWIALRDSNGSPIKSPLLRTAFGDLTGGGGLDVLTVSGRLHTLYPETGGRQTVARAIGAQFLAAEDINNDGIRDVFMILADGSWALARGGDVLGDLDVLCRNPMNVREVKLVRLEGTARPVHAVAWINNRLMHVDLVNATGGSECTWNRVFLRSGKDPLPTHIKSINDLWFVHVDRDSGPRVMIDLVAASDGKDGSGLPIGAPAFIPNILGSNALGMSPINIESIAGVDLRHAAVVGHFAEFSSNRLRGSFLSLGEIIRNIRSPEHVLGIGTRYGNWSETRLARALPSSLLDSGHDIDLPELRIGERFEYEARFISPVAVSDLHLHISRRNRYNRQGVPDTETLVQRKIRGGGQFKTYRGVFVPERPGIYSVSVSASGASASPTLGIAASSASWKFLVPGAICGDGVPEDAEVCDWGRLNSDTDANTCRADCSAPRCGDGVVDSNETCDEGRQNGKGLSPTCLSNCALATCGDGVLDDGEECDWGIQNSDTLSGACRTTCVLSKCGDGILDEGEECDDGPLNADRIDACRLDCTLPRCGDGIADTGEHCDGSEYCSESCYCTDGTAPWIMHGVCSKPIG